MVRSKKSLVCDRKGTSENPSNDFSRRNHFAFASKDGKGSDFGRGIGIWLLLSHIS